MRVQIGVLSDTHLRRPDAALENILEKVFEEMDFIVHAGDIVSRSVLDTLEDHGVLCVCGNMDDYAVAESIPQSRFFHAANKKIGVIHGWGSKERLAERISDKLNEHAPDLIIFGHSHVPFWEKVNGIHMFNPGSFSENRLTSGGTVGIVTITDGDMEGRFLPVKR